MTIELMTVITVASVIFGIYQGVVNMKRNQKTDVREETAEATTMIVKLESIQKDTTEIKNEVKSLREDTKKNTEQIIRIDESLKSAWNAINKLQDRSADDGK